MIYNIIYKKAYLVGGVYLDIQLKRGLIEICVLKSLTEEDSYGYQLIKKITPHLDISESTLYPILKRLESSGLLEVYSVEHNGRLRKYYKITDSGRRRIEEFLIEWREIMEVYKYIKGDNDE